MKNWKAIARAEGRICPECLRPVSRATWKAMQTKNGPRPCWLCREVHWEIPVGAGGSAFRDNADREALDEIRSSPR